MSKIVRLSFKMSDPELVFSRRKVLTTRRSNTAGLEPGELGAAGLAGRVVYLRGRGARSFQDTLAEFGGIEGYLAAEGGLDQDAFFHKLARRVKWVQRWVEGEIDAYLYDVSADPFPGQREVPLGYVSIVPAGLESQICSAVFTVWGLGQDGNYQPGWQSPVLTAQDLQQIVISSPEARTSVEAIRAWVEQRSGLSTLAASTLAAGVEPAVPYSIVAALAVDSRLPLPARPLSMGIGVCRGRRAPVGLFLSYVRPSCPLAPKTKDIQYDFQPARESERDSRRLMEALALVSWDKSHGRLLPLRGTHHQPRNAFTREALAGTKEVVRAKRLIEATKEKSVEAELEGKKPRKLKTEDPYHLALSMGVLPSVIPLTPTGRDPSGRILTHEKVGKEVVLTEGFFPSEEFGGEGRFLYRDIFSFAVSICRQTGLCVPFGARRTKTTGLFEKRMGEVVGLRKTSGGENLILRLLADYGLIDESFDPGDRDQLREALVQLKKVIKDEYKQAILTPERVPIGEHGEGQEEAAFAEDYYQALRGELAEENSGERWRRSRRNPIRREDVEPILDYAKASEKKKRELEEKVSGIFDRIVRESQPEEWVFTGEHVQELFPRRGGKGQWTPQARLDALATAYERGTKFDMIQRLGSPPAQLREEGRSQAERLAAQGVLPFDDPAVLQLVAAEAGLSLNDVIKILQTQEGARRITRVARPGGKSVIHSGAIQSSSAVCKVHRQRRLAFQPPAEMLRKGTVLLLMSPPTAYSPRVMTFRHGYHIDCDMVGENPGELPEVLGRALQATLLWKVERETPGEKKSRRGRHEIAVLVGRVGHPYLYVALRPKEVVSIAQVTANLKRGQAGDDVYREPVTAYASEQARERDVLQYMDILRQQIGEKAARGFEKGPSPEMRAPPVEAPLEPELPVEEASGLEEEAAEGGWWRPN